MPPAAEKKDPCAGLMQAFIDCCEAKTMFHCEMEAELYKECRAEQVERAAGHARAGGAAGKSGGEGAK